MRPAPRFPLTVVCLGCGAVLVDVANGTRDAVIATKILDKPEHVWLHDNPEYLSARCGCRAWLFDAVSGLCGWVMPDGCRNLGVVVDPAKSFGAVVDLRQPIAEAIARAEAMAA